MLTSHAKSPFSRRVELLARNLGQNFISVTQARTCNDLETAARFVHDVYVDKGYILPQPDGIWRNEFYQTPKMTTFIARDQKGIIGTISVVVNPNGPLPSDAIYPQELNTLREQSRKIGEVTGLAVSKCSRNGGPFLELGRVAYGWAAKVAQLDNFFVEISPGHLSLFTDILQFVPCGQKRKTNSGTEDVVVGATMDIAKARKSWQALDEQLRNEDVDFSLYEFFVTKNPYFEL